MRTMVVVILCAIGAAGQEPAVTLPDGATFAVRLSHSVNAAHTRAGDPVEATLLVPVLSHGAVLVPRNARISGRVLAADGRHNGSSSRLLIRFELALWRDERIALNAYMVRQLVLRSTVTGAAGNNPCPSIARFDFQRGRDRDPASLPQTPHVDTLPCEGRIGSTTALFSDRLIFTSPPLKNMRLQHAAQPPGATELVSKKKNVELARGTLLELRQSVP